jgi:hypothetical protein
MLPITASLLTGSEPIVWKRVIAAEKEVDHCSFFFLTIHGVCCSGLHLEGDSNPEGLPTLS